MYLKASFKTASIALIVLTLGFSFISCEERSIDPFEGEQGVYSVYGALKVGDSTNYIRVRDLLQPFRSDSTYLMDATVTITNLSTDESIELRDTVVTFNGNETHNYIFNKDLELDTQYQITVEGNDGRSVTSVATTPGLTEAKHLPNDEFVFCETPVNFTFANVHPPEFVQMEIGAEYDGTIHWAPMEVVGEIEYNAAEDHMSVQMRPRNLLVEIFTPVIPDNPYFNRYLLFPTVGCNQLDSNIIRIRYTHFGPEWGTGRPQENGPIDIESGLIENGLGFFGAYRTDTLQVHFSDLPDEE